MESTEVVINLHNITKTYKLYRSRHERIMEWLIPNGKKRHSDHFALHDINFSVQKGEVIGLIGKNGSGKSTLLKIITGVVSPTSGTFTSKGNITALLELGAGFNKELTGIENLYFLGAIQGIEKAAMESKIQDILAFAEIGEYAWQPVKNYSSGMYVRLAFSLSIHIDVEILIIDEALSVGDVRFQQKCFRKIRQFKEQGKTIIFCSHSMQAIRDFCTKAIWIHEGNIKEIGHPNTVTEHYNIFMTTGSTISRVKNNWNSRPQITLNDQIPPYLQCTPWINFSISEQSGSKTAKIEAISIQNEDANLLSFASGGQRIKIFVLITTKEIFSACDVQFIVNNSFGQKVIEISSRQYGKKCRLTPDKIYFLESQWILPELTNGRYSISAVLKSYQNESWQIQHVIHDAFFFHIKSDGAIYNTNAQLVVKEVQFESQDFLQITA